MGAALASVDVVGKAENALGIGVGVAQGYLHLHQILLAGEVDGLFVQGLALAADVVHELGDAALVEKLGFLLIALVAELDAQASVQKAQLAQASGQDLEGILGGLENFGVGLEGDLGAGAFAALADHLQLAGGVAVIVGLGVDLAVALDLHLQPLAERVDHAHAHAVQAAGHLVGLVVELAARVQLGHDHLHGGDAFALVHVHRDAPAVVLHRHAVVGVDDHLHVVAVSAHGLVHRVVHHLVDQVVQPIGAGGADVHGRALAHRVQAFQDLDFF